MTAPAPPRPRPTTLADAFRFFVPLVLMTELNMISKSVIHAFVARLPAPKLNLAAFNLAFFFYYTLTTPTEVAHLLSISYLRDRRSARHLVGFFALLLALPLMVAVVVGVTPVGRWLYGGLFGGSPEVARGAQSATLILMGSAPPLICRALGFAMIMLNRRTLLITASTLLRVASLGVSLVVFPYWMEGSAVGAAALVMAMWVEGCFALAVSLRFFRALPEPEARQPSYKELWRFSWPLILNQTTEAGSGLLINFFLGRLAKADLALAAFGVVHGLAGLILAPLRNLVQTAQTLVRSAADLPVLFRFARMLVAGFTALVMGLFLTPARGWLLDRVMGLNAELSAYCAPAVMLTFLLTVGWGYAALFRGLLAGQRRTGTLATSGAARLAMVTGIGSMLLAWSDANGAVFGMVAWAGAFTAQAVVLGWRLFGRTPGLEPLFPRGRRGEE